MRDAESQKPIHNRLESQPRPVSRPPVQRQHLPPPQLLLPKVLRHASPDLRQRAPHDLPKVPLVLGVQGDDAGLVGAHDGLAGFHDARARFHLQLVGDQQQQEAALQQVHAEEERHELEPRVVLEDVVDRLGGRHGVPGGVDEGLRGDPEVVVVEERDRVPFAREEDVEDVHYVRAVG